MHEGVTREVKFLHVDNLVQLLGGRLRVDFDLLGEYSFPIDGQLAPPSLQGLGIVDDQCVWIVLGEGVGFGVMDTRMVAVDFGQATVAFQWGQVADGGVAAIEFKQVLQLTQGLQVADSRA